MVTSIVVGMDGSEHGFRARDWAVDLARHTDAGLTLVHAFDPLGILGEREPPIDFAEVREEVATRLEDEWAEPARRAGVTVTTVLSEQKPLDALLGAVEAAGADLVVVGTRGLGAVRGAVLGSVTRALTQRCPCPVTVVPG